jgi:hypothetical protein
MSGVLGGSGWSQVGVRTAAWTRAAPLGAPFSTRPRTSRTIITVPIDALALVATAFSAAVRIRALLAAVVAAAGGPAP